MATSNIKGYVPDLSGLNKQARAAIEKGVNDGLFCTDVVEALPNRERGGCEKVIKGRNNAWIVLGRDRPTSIVSGAGGAGQTQCGMIDMVVGLAAGESIKKMKKGDNPKGPDDVVSPNFGSDAARLYMSQRCPGNGGIDGYLGLTRVKGPSAMNKSAIAMKADHVRIVGRECVRIYASRGQNFQGFGIGGEKTTLGTAISNSRIDLVAGREEDLQPAVLGNNLKQYLEQKDDAVTEILRTIINMIDMYH